MTLADAEQEARLARSVLSKLEHQAVAARESGTKMSAAWWTYFGDVYSSVQVAERKVRLLREDLEKGR